MKKLLLPFAAILIITYSFITPQFTSQLTIKPHEQFFLGGGQSKVISAYAKNVGAVPVTISIRMSDGIEKELIILQPGKDIKAQAPSKAAMLFLNASDQEAKLDVKANGKPESLNMYYKPEKR
jgi:hypothetical protein